MDSPLQVQFLCYYDLCNSHFLIKIFSQFILKNSLQNGSVINMVLVFLNLSFPVWALLMYPLPRSRGRSRPSPSISNSGPCRRLTNNPALIWPDQASICHLSSCLNKSWGRSLNLFFVLQFWRNITREKNAPLCKRWHESVHWRLLLWLGCPLPKCLISQIPSVRYYKGGNWIWLLSLEMRRWESSSAWAAAGSSPARVALAMHSCPLHAFPATRAMAEQAFTLCNTQPGLFSFI